MTKSFTLALLTGAAVAMSGRQAFAGPADAAVPSISNSQTTRVVFLAPGVIKNNGLETAFTCTSLDTVATTLAVELFDPDTGAVLNNVAVGTANGAIALPAGGSRTIATGASAGLHEDTDITGVTNLKNGAARILATTSKIMCTGMLVEKLGATPAAITTIKLIAQRRQNGD